MSGHTPGPWRVELDDRGHVVSVRASGIAPGAVEAKVLRDNSFMLPSSSRAHANARLIAAAPEMLEALRGIVEIIDRNDREINWCADLDAIRRCRGIALEVVAERARAAIAKAVKP